MGYLRGFLVTAGKMFKSTESGRMVTVPYVKDGGPKREKPERLHGRPLDALAISIGGQDVFSPESGRQRNWGHGYQ